MSFVLDGSAALAWCFADETTPPIEELFLRIPVEGSIVPSIWRLEVANGLLRGTRKGRISPADRTSALSILDRLRIAVDGETDRHAWQRTIEIAEKHGLSAYDASYLELALRRGVPLASLDGPLVKAAHAAGAAVLTL